MDLRNKSGIVVQQVSPTEEVGGKFLFRVKIFSQQVGDERCAGVRKQACRGRRPKARRGEVSGSRSRSQAGFLDEAGEGQHGREGISDQDGLGRISEAEEGGAFQAAVSLGGIAALGIGLSADA